MGKDHKGSSLTSFQQRFSTEYSCIEYLARMRWPTGYKCQKCGCEKAYQLKVEPRVFQCSDCRFQESVTAGTLLHRTRTPLVKWFWAAYLLSQDKRGISTMQLSRELDLHYATAWTMLQKLRWALSHIGGFPLTGVVEVDETYYGGKGGHDSLGRRGCRKSGFVAGNAKVAVAASASADALGPFLQSQPGAGDQPAQPWMAWLHTGREKIPA